MIASDNQNSDGNYRTDAKDTADDVDGVVPEQTNTKTKTSAEDMEDHSHTGRDIKPAIINMDEQENLDIAECTDISEEKPDIEHIESNISKTDHSESDDDICDIVLANVDKTQLNDSEADMTTPSNGRHDENTLKHTIEDFPGREISILTAVDFPCGETLPPASDNFPNRETLVHSSQDFPNGKTLILATEGFPGESSTDDVDHVNTDYHTETNEGTVGQLVPYKNQEELQLNPTEPAKEQECDKVIHSHMDMIDDLTNTIIKGFENDLGNDSSHTVIEESDVTSAEDGELCLDKEVKKVEKVVNDKQTKLVEVEEEANAAVAIDKLRISDDGLSGESSTDEMYVTYLLYFKKKKNFVCTVP